MTQRLAIGVVDAEPGWEIVLGQIGAWTERVDWSRLDASRYAAVVVNRSLSRGEGEAIESYLRAGGAVLDGGGFAAHAGKATRPRSIGALLATELESTIALDEHHGGAIAHVPFDIGGIMRSHRSARRLFPSPGGHHPDEVVARVAKNPFRIVVASALERLHARRDLPFVHRWHLPGDARSIFIFRIDSDYGTPESMLRLRDLADRHAIAMTIFLHVGAHVDHLGLFRDFAPHELAVHGYRHRTFGDYEANWANVNEALALMRRSGLEPTGFAAPTGRWNLALDRALRDLGFDYSSEFTLDVDGLPFQPWAVRDASPVLQVPIHPISVGNLARAGADEREMLAYFEAVIDRQIERRLPIVLYHHPLQEAWDLFDRLLERVRGEGIRSMTMGDYARWWRERSRSRFSAELDDGRLRVASIVDARETTLRVVSPDGSECYLATDADVAPADLPWTRVARGSMSPTASLASIRRPALRLLRHALEDAVSRFRQ
jgi:peptidoglycan/xylan/chitin deacetylase (PgdA/CDA1 family)